MDREVLLTQLADAYTKLGIEFLREQAADLEIHVELLRAGWSLGKRRTTYDAYLLANESTHTVYFWQKTTDRAAGLSLGAESETYSQTGKLLLRKVTLRQYGPEGKVCEMDVNLGELAEIARETARRNGWRFRAVLRTGKAQYAKG